jgi:SAM-dependent methyltransferase
LTTPDTRDRFSPVAAAYARGRPSYPPNLVEWVVREAGVRPGARVVDLGSGTGLAARLFAARGFPVVGVDPSAEMLAQARTAGGGPRYVRATGESSGLAGGCAALVTVAQALHWFDLPRALGELARLLQPGGHVAAFWNERRDSPLMQAYDALLRRHAAQFRDRHYSQGVLAGLRYDRRVTGLREARFACRQELDWPGFLARVSSSSYVAHGLQDRPGFEAGLRALFDGFSRAGRLVLDYDTPAVVFGLEGR